MDEISIIKKLEEVFEDVLDEGTVILKNETVADDVEGWDSLSHMELIVAIEKEFDITFTSFEIEKFTCVGDICNLIKSKI